MLKSAFKSPKSTTHCLSSLVFLMVAAWASMASGQAKVANVEGSYVGLFANGATGRISPAVLPYIEQDNAILAGQLVNSELGFLDAFGAIHPNDKCNLILFGNSAVSNYKASWERIGDGAGALTGPITAFASSQRIAGPLVLLRRFAGPETGRPAIAGNYSGLGVTSSLAMQVSGTTGVHPVNLSLTIGRTTSNYAAVMDVSPLGRIAAVGVRPNGDILRVSGQIQDGTSNTIVISVSVTNSAGKLIHTDSIIAILIG